MSEKTGLALHDHSQHSEKVFLFLRCRMHSYIAEAEQDYFPTQTSIFLWNFLKDRCGLCFFFFKQCPTKVELSKTKLMKTNTHL